MSVFKRWNGTQWETIGPGVTSVRFDNINNMIAPEFDPKNTYDIGDYVVQSDKLYRCISRIGTPRSWYSEDWREVKLGQDVTELRNDVVAVSNTQPTSENNRIWVKPDNNDMKIPLVEDVMMLPSSNNYGENGQYPRSTGSSIEWTDYGLPSDQQTEDAINAWLNVHPEATTTVQDYSLTDKKFAKGIMKFTTPEMYGAIGDGVTNDTSAFNEMFSFGPSVVYLRNRYLISSITIPEKTIIIGGEILSDGTEKNTIELNSDITFKNVKFSDILLENKTTTVNNVLYGHQINNIQVINCLFKNIHLGSCIYLSESSNIDITYTIIDGYMFSGIMLFNGCTDINVCYNKVLNGTYTGEAHRYPICLSGYAATSRGPALRIKCNYNLIDDSETEPVWEGIDSHSCCDAEFKFNTIIGTKSGIVLTNPTSAPVQPNKNIIVEGNTINITTSDVSDGIVTTNNSILKDITIIRNSISINCNPGLYSSAIRIIGTNIPEANNIRVIDNTILTNGQGIYLSLKIMKNINIIGNRIDGCTTLYPAIKITASGFEKININDNAIGTIQSTNRGISLQNTNTLDNSELIVCHNNIFGEVTTPFINLLMTNKPSSSAQVKRLVAGKPGDFVPADGTESGIAGFVYNNGAWNIVPCNSLQ